MVVAAVELDWKAPLDPEAYIADTPAMATTKGMFNTSIAELGRRSAPTREDDVFEGVAARRWPAFADVSLREHMRLLVNVARLRYPREPLREGLRRLGWLAYPTFAESTPGRVLLMLSEGIESVLRASPKAFALSVSPCRVETTKVGPRHYRVDGYQIYCFLDAYQVGVLEGIAHAHREKPHVTLALRNLHSGSLDFTW